MNPLFFFTKAFYGVSNIEGLYPSASFEVTSDASLLRAPFPWLDRTPDLKNRFGLKQIYATMTPRHFKCPTKQLPLGKMTEHQWFHYRKLFFGGD